MHMFFVFYSLIFKHILVDWCYQSEFTCSHTCPEVWEGVSYNCGGRFQSPVNIVTKKNQLDECLTPFHFSGYQDTFYGRLLNNGHSGTLQLHLHWGRDGGLGSEHTIDGERFPMEIHIVHIKEEYNSLSEAVRDRTGAAVLGFFFQVILFGYFVVKLAIIMRLKVYNSTTLRGVSLEMLIPHQENMTKYFRYSGSLTTPNCSEAVVWSLFENPIPLSRKQLTAFSQLLFPDGKPMVKTYRPLQPMNRRQVYYSSGNVALVSTVLPLMSVLVSSALCLHTTG
uniref:Carbonic anhydrase n=1 Tax=Sparus aurata TaxID=8175 RepID=A0A671TG77_SPAAU